MLWRKVFPVLARRHNIDYLGPEHILFSSCLVSHWLNLKCDCCCSPVPHLSLSLSLSPKLSEFSCV